MLKSRESVESPEMPCKLRRFATGLPGFAWSRFIIASLRLSGLAVDVANASALTSKNLETVLRDAPEISRCILWRDGFSRFLRDDGLRDRAKFAKLLFSWPPSASGAGEGGVTEFPKSEVALKARFKGLLGERRAVRDNGFAVAAFGLAERKESFTPDRKGVEKFVWCCKDAGADGGTVFIDELICLHGDCGEGVLDDSWELSEAWDGVLPRAHLEGDLDNERRRDLTTAAPMST